MAGRDDLGAGVCIVGAGAAGGILAAELARKGIKVVVLESGPRHDFTKRPQYARQSIRGLEPWRTPVAEIDRHTTAGGFRFNLDGRRVRGVGGSTLHWEGYTLRFHADDFRLRSLYGIADDWAISYKDLEPYYARAEGALGVAGAADDPWGSPRSPQAEATGNARVLPDTTVLRLEAPAPGHVSGVVYAGHDRRERRLSAPIVVLAANGVETARLLLLSANEHSPAGLANGSGLAGKYFMSHPEIDVVGRVKFKIHPHRVGFSTAITRQFGVPRERATTGSFFLEFLNQAGPLPDRIALASGKWGAELREHVQREFGHTVAIRVYCEQLPDLENTISLDPSVRDYFGNPVPRVTYDIGRYERDTLRAGQAVATRILQQMGTEDIGFLNLESGAHLLGTHRMGRDPRHSVVDANLRAHDVENLYLVGGGCFVTASSAYPTLTIAALAIRAAEHIASRLRARA